MVKVKENNVDTKLDDYQKYFYHMIDEQFNNIIGFSNVHKKLSNLF